MVTPSELLLHAATLLAAGPNKERVLPPEADIRRAVSASYYALFHTLTLDGAARFSLSVPALQPRMHRSFEHRQMKGACEVLERWNKGQQTEALRPLLTAALDAGLIRVVDAFLKLQVARHKADYDLAARFPLDQAVRLHRLAHEACLSWAAVRDTPDAAVFLTLLLLGDRLYRRG